MKKIAYSKITKLIVWGITIILTVILFMKSVNMIGTYSEYCNLYKEAEDIDNMWESRPDEIMEYTLENIISEMVIWYANDGLKGVSDYIENYEDRWSHDVTSVFYVLFATEDESYTNIPDGMPEEWKSLEMEYIESLENPNEVFFDGVDKVNCYNMVRLETETGRVYNAYNEIIYEANLDDIEFIENDEVLTFDSALKKIDKEMAIKVYLTNAYEITVYNDYFTQYDAILNYVRNDCKADIRQQAMGMIAPAVALIIMLIVEGLLCGKKTDGSLYLSKWDNKATELHILVIALLCAPLVILYCWIYSEVVGRYYSNGWIKQFLTNPIIYTYIIVGTALVMGVFYELGVLVKKLKAKRFVKDFLAVKLIAILARNVWTELKRAYAGSFYVALPRIKKIYIRKVAMDIVVAVVTVVILNQIAAHSEQLVLANYKVIDWFGYEFAIGKYLSDPILLYVFSFIAVICYYINSFIEYKNLRRYNKVVKAIETIYYGNYKSFTVDESEKDDALKMLANLSENFEESVRKQVEAEKMQIELVANVSHDLKTPLTSIISYVELLKEEEMSDVARDYVKVLSDKSDRLKDIVADVFDLAKATSGEKVPMEELDGVVLVNQVLSDMQDKIDASGRELRTKITPDSAPLIGNGQKLYRVFQNIIDNALKYSMPGTRIYLTADMEGSEFVVTLKNVSEYEMDFTAEQVMSRFTRGDKSRHSEGNGLGLSIAKSFTELMGGTFDVEIDDDVFKTIVRLR